MEDITDITAFNEARRNNIFKGFSNTDDLLEKGGEGSRGGKISGHTKSGKAIYAGSGKLTNVEHYSAQDHADAAAHLDELGKSLDESKPRVALGHLREAAAHRSMGATKSAKKGSYEHHVILRRHYNTLGSEANQKGQDIFMGRATGTIEEAKDFKKEAGGHFAQADKHFVASINSKNKSDLRPENIHPEHAAAYAKDRGTEA